MRSYQPQAVRAFEPVSDKQLASADRPHGSVIEWHDVPVVYVLTGRVLIPIHEQTLAVREPHRVSGDEEFTCKLSRRSTANRHDIRLVGVPVSDPLAIGGKPRAESLRCDQ